MDVRIGTESLKSAQEILRTLGDRAVKALVPAVNRAVKSARAEAGRAITERYAISSKEAKAQLEVDRATYSAPVGTLRARGETLKLTDFPHRPISPGTGGPGKPSLRAEIKRGQWKKIPGAFVAPIGGKNRVMARRGKARGAMFEMAALPVPTMFGMVRERVEQYALEIFEQRLAHEIRRQIEKAAK
jgi:hypothetical protein